MTVANYNSLVQKTFCENAIRSVVMIDDDFLTYSESIRALNNEVDLDYNKIDSSKRAATLESFFQSKNMICDVDNGSVNFDVDRIRKSDLIIVDYHLDNNAPDKTLKLLQDLKDSDHLNMIVIYTRENLETVWMQISSTLKGALDINSLIIDYDNEDVQSYWEDVVLPNLNDNGNKALTRDETIAYIMLSMVCIPAVIIGVGLSYTILNIWLGKEYAENSTYILQVLLIGFLFNSYAQIPFATIQAAGKAKITALIHCIEIIPYLVGLYFFIIHFGVIGAAYAWTIRVSLDFVILLVASRGIYKSW